MDINVIDCDPIKAKSYIPLDEKLARKMAIINIKNKDNECFKWCITRALNPKEIHPERVDKDLRKQSKKLNWDKIEFPASLNQITQFEKNNPDISVNVFENKSVYILYVSKNANRKHVIDLLLISNGETNHYYLSRLLSLQTSKHHGAKHYCRNCLLGFSSEKSLSNHKLYSESHKSVRIVLSEEGTKIQFSNHNSSMRVPFVMVTLMMLTLRVLLNPSIRVHQIKTNPIL